MPPKRKAGAGRKPKSKLLQAQVLPIGQMLTDLTKRSWSLGAKVGMGGCGEIFLAAPHGESFTPDQATHVIKIEPHANGPLFSELAFYHRAAKADMINSWQRSHKDVSYVGVPAYVAEGWHEQNGERWRFMVMVRFGEDLEMLFNQHGRQFSLPTVYTLAVNLLHSLEYLHSNEYVHADIKGANLLIGRTKPKRHEVFLVDYGLAYRYLADGKHREYQEDPRCLHDGTIEFTSRDAHKGVRPSRRGDMEIMGFVLVQWACGVLPWESKIADKDVVAKEKDKFMKNPTSHLNKLFSPQPVPACFQTFFSEIARLGYEERPDYTKLIGLFTKELSSLKIGPKSTVHLDWMQSATPTKRRSQSDHSRTPPKKLAGIRENKNRRSKRISDSPTSEEDSTPKKKTKFNSPGSKKPISVALSMQGLRRSPRSNKGVAPSKTLRDRRKATYADQVSPIQNKRFSTDDDELLADSPTLHKKNRFRRVNDVYNFRYDDEVVVPVSPVLPSTPALSGFSSPPPSIPVIRLTDAMREVASKAGKRKAAGKERKKQTEVSKSDDELEIVSASSNDSKTGRAKSKPTSSSANGNALSNPTPEMLLVMDSKTKPRRRK